MSRRILVLFAMPEIGKVILKKAKAEITFLHGPRGEQPGSAELVTCARGVHMLIQRAILPIPNEVLTTNPNLRGIAGGQQALSGGSFVE